VAVLYIVIGCLKAPEPQVEPAGVRLALNWQVDKTLDYTFISERKIEIQWDPNTARTDPGRKNTNQMTERLELDMSYTPMKVTAHGTVEVAVVCRSARVERSKLDGTQVAKKDCVESFKGKEYTLIVDANGRITDANALDQLLKKLGEKAFQADRSRGRIKKPEMIADLVVTQWFLWDAVAAAKGKALHVGDTWTSWVSIPTPMVMRKAREVTYRLQEIQDQNDLGPVAVIHSTFALSQKKAPSTWPIPYAGRFRVSGPFGFLRGYQVVSLEGSGQERFLIDQGRTEGYEQQYQMVIDAVIPMGLRASPRIIINQTLTMRPSQ
jgi:hypothetical protein